MLFQVRVPSFERPGMLQRALFSLRAQTYPDWQAIVFDDSRTFGVRDVVSEIKDERIRYVRNPSRLGAALNIDQCFSPSIGDAADYACLLEDDNFWLPGFLALIADKVNKKRRNLVLANQRINREAGGLLSIDVTTRGDWFSAGDVQPIELWSSLFFMEGISNGGMIWDLKSGVDLRVGRTVNETSLQEACRTLLIKEPVLFVAEALAVWTDLPKLATARHSESNRMFGRGMQSLREFVLRTCLDESLVAARKIALRKGLLTQLAQAVAYSGFLGSAAGLIGFRRELVKAWIKGKLLRIIQFDPCRDFVRLRGEPLTFQRWVT